MPDRHDIRLEICVDTPEGLATAVAAGADRIELCAALDLGGLTPAPGLMAAARGCGVPVYAMIRPRAGGFVFAAADCDAMLADIAAVRAVGLAGIVLGASRPDGTLDVEILARLSDAAGGLGRTLHRAFDLVPDQRAALETAVGLGFERVLTSGGALSAPEGQDRLRALVGWAGDRLAVMAGGGLRPDNVVALLRATGVREVHASARRMVPSDPELIRWGFAGAHRAVTDGPTVTALRQVLQAGQAP